MEAYALSYIEKITGCPIPGEDLVIALKDGVHLCRLVKKIRRMSSDLHKHPNGIKDEKSNIEAFLTEAARLNCAYLFHKDLLHDLLVEPALKKQEILRTLVAISEATKSLKYFKGPYLEIDDPSLLAPVFAATASASASASASAQSASSASASASSSNHQRQTTKKSRSTCLRKALSSMFLPKSILEDPLCLDDDRFFAEDLTIIEDGLGEEENNSRSPKRCCASSSSSASSASSSAVSETEDLDASSSSSSSSSQKQLRRDYDQLLQRFHDLDLQNLGLLEANKFLTEKVLLMEERERALQRELEEQRKKIRAEERQRALDEFRDSQAVFRKFQDDAQENVRLLEEKIRALEQQHAEKLKQMELVAQELHQQIRQRDQDILRLQEEQQARERHWQSRLQIELDQLALQLQKQFKAELMDQELRSFIASHKKISKLEATLAEYAERLTEAKQREANDEQRRQLIAQQEELAQLIGSSSSPAHRLHTHYQHPTQQNQQQEQQEQHQQIDHHQHHHFHQNITTTTTTTRRRKQKETKRNRGTGRSRWLLATTTTTTTRTRTRTTARGQVKIKR